MVLSLLSEPNKLSFFQKKSEDPLIRNDNAQQLKVSVSLISDNLLAAI